MITEQDTARSIITVICRNWMQLNQTKLKNYIIIPNYTDLKACIKCRRETSTNDRPNLKTSAILLWRRGRLDPRLHGFVSGSRQRTPARPREPGQRPQQDPKRHRQEPPGQEAVHDPARRERTRPQGIGAVE